MDYNKVTERSRKDLLPAEKREKADRYIFFLSSYQSRQHSR